MIFMNFMMNYIIHLLGTKYHQYINNTKAIINHKQNLKNQREDEIFYISSDSILKKKK